MNTSTEANLSPCVRVFIEWLLRTAEDVTEEPAPVSGKAHSLSPAFAATRRPSPAAGVHR
jgi:hypothetical protein